MTTHLVSILGLPRIDKSGDRRYLRTGYQFPGTNAEMEVETTTFGLALAQWLPRRPGRPLSLDRILWLGTTSSAWGSLLQAVLEEGAANHPVFNRLYEASVARKADVDEVAGILSQTTGQRHECRIVPPCADPKEQEAFLALLGRELKPGDRVVLDLTHGLRNQSLMLAQSAIVLEGAYGVRIEGMYYGGLEIPRPSDARAPVVDLIGVLDAARLAQAVGIFRETDDVRPLAQHLPPGGFQRQIENLGQAVAVNDLSRARQLAASAASSAQSADLGLLGPAIAQALQAFRGSTLSDNQFARARRCIAKGDWEQATLSIFEGAVSSATVNLGLSAERFQDHREEAGRALARSSPTFRAIRVLRNRMAHGVSDPGKGSFQLPWWSPVPLTHQGLTGLIQNPERLEKFLFGALKHLENEAGTVREVASANPSREGGLP